MKKIVCMLLSVSLMFSFFVFDTSAAMEEAAPYVIDFTLTSADTFSEENVNERVSGLILSYGISIEKSGTSSIVIKGKTYCASDVVKCGFKNLTVERRKSSSYSWSDYYDYGDVYRDTSATTLNTTLSVASGYQYRVTCKHYAKKNLLLTENISNASAVLTM